MFQALPYTNRTFPLSRGDDIILTLSPHPSSSAPTTTPPPIQASQAQAPPATAPPSLGGRNTSIHDNPYFKGQFHSKQQQEVEEDEDEEEEIEDDFEGVEYEPVPEEDHEM